MPDIEALGILLAALLAADPPKRPDLLRPRPPYLPHPHRKLPYLRGVVFCVENGSRKVSLLPIRMAL